MSDMFRTETIFARTHELKMLMHLHPGYAAICYCDWGTGYRRLAFFAVLAHSRHRSKKLRGLS